MSGAGLTPPILATLKRFRPSPEEVILWWLGQSGFALRGPNVTALIDPFLSGHEGRRFPPAFAPESAENIDVVFCTHEHLDHFDAAAVQAIAAASPHAQIVVPEPIVNMVTELGIARDRVIPARQDEQLAVAGVEVTPVPAVHGVHAADAYTFGEAASGAMRFLGYVLRINDVTLYHAGDTLIYDGQAGRLRRLQVDLALLPINGRTPEREAQDLVGNMNAEEAIALAISAQVDAMIPMHYDMFAANLGSPQNVISAVVEGDLDVTVILPSRTRPLIYSPSRLRST